MEKKVISLPSARRQEMDKTLPSAKAIAYSVGTVIAITGLRTASYKLDGEDVANDKLVIKATGSNGNDGEALFPVRELLKSAIADGSEDLFKEEGDTTVFPQSLKIVAAEDRKDRNGNPVYPVNAYKAFEEQIEANNGIDWNALVASGVKDDNKLSPVQNYTFMIEG